MSREIKFRAWVENEHVQSSVYPFMNYKIVFSGGLVNDIFATSGTQPINTMHNKITYMQYTGLKDKNGLEIYEGDILAFEDEDFKWIVKYDYGSCIAVGGEHNQSEELIEFYDWSKERLEVVIVGNIYEHPHLLEVAQ